MGPITRECVAKLPLTIELTPRCHGGPDQDGLCCRVVRRSYLSGILPAKHERQTGRQVADVYRGRDGAGQGIFRGESTSLQMAIPLTFQFYGCNVSSPVRFNAVTDASLTLPTRSKQAEGMTFLEERSSVSIDPTDR